MKKAKRKAGFLTAFVTLATSASLVFAAAAYAGEMKSDPDNYYLDPDEIRLYVKNSITGTVMLKKRAEGPEGCYANINERDVFLLDGQIPLYGIDDDVVAYIYLAYVGPGPLPTIGEMVKKAREVSDDRKEVIRNQETSGVSLREFDAQHFPHGYLCAYALIGINERCTIGMDTLGLPRYILSQKEAEDAARVYYASSNFELVKYIFAATLHGYEFTDGSRNIIVPLHTLSGHVYADEILTREEIEANINEYRYTFDPESARKWVEKWKRRLEAIDCGCDFDPDYEIPDTGYYGKGPWCYLHQTKYNDEMKKLWKNGWYNWKKSPELDDRGFNPRQYSLFGTCLPIACASVLAYFEGTGNKRLLKNDNEWDYVDGFEGGQYIYPRMRSVQKYYAPPPYSDATCNFAAYMSLLVGAIYQNYDYGGKDFSFFDRGQGTEGGGDMAYVGAIPALEETIKDFNASTYYKNITLDNEPPDPETIYDRVTACHPFAATYPFQGGPHMGAVYGFKGFNYTYNTMDKLGVFDWYDNDWPEKATCIYYDYDIFSYSITVGVYGRHLTLDYVDQLRLYKTRKNKILSWKSDARSEAEVLGYNVVYRDNAEAPLNAELIRADARFGGGEYAFNVPVGCNVANTAVQVIFKNGYKLEYRVVGNDDDKEGEDDVQ